MKNRIASQDWDFKFDITKKRFNLKDGILHWIEKQFGIRLFEYRNYRIIR